MNSILKLLIKLQSDSGNVMTEARKVITQLESIQEKASSVGASIKKAFSPSALGDSLMSIPGMQFLTNPYTLLASGIGAVAKIGAEAEMTATTFTALAGSEEKAKSILGEIGKFASESPFGKLNLTRNAQQMLSFGVSTDKVMTYLKQLGDISAGSKDRLASLSLAMGQVTTNGKLMGQDLLQFINAGFNPLKELQKMHPEVTYEALQEAMGKGAISADMVASAIEHATAEGGQFHGLVKSTAQTIGVRWTSLMEQLREMAIQLFEQIRPFISSFLDLFSKAIPYISKAISGFFSILAGVINFVKNWWRELALVGSIIGIVAIAINAKTIALTAYAGVMSAVSIATQAWTAMQWLLNVAMSANPIGIVIVAVATLTAGIIYLWNKFASFRAFLMTAWDTFKELGSIIKDYVVNRINEMLEGLGKVGKALQLLLSGDFSEAWSTFKDGVGNLAGKDSAKTAVLQTKQVIEGVKGDWQRNLETEQAKDLKKLEKKSQIETPALKGSAPSEKLDLSGGKGGKGGKGNKTAEAIAMGGSKPTIINVSIKNLIERFEVTMMDRADTNEIERVVLQALNRSLAIATSTD
nr:tape measure protein [uncultured Porphyromonas sp.]